MKLCGAVRLSIRGLRIEIEAISGEPERSTTLEPGNGVVRASETLFQ